jgi:murein DD-endopeptidase MepM/ murein hydrolase activator NlpD
MNLLKIANYAGTAKKIGSDPLGFIFDSIVIIIINLIIPVPLVGAVVSTFRPPILGFLASLIALTIMMIIAVGTILFSPMLIPGQILQNITSIFQVNDLNIAPDTSFVSTSVPRQNPFGGSGMSYTNITANFLDPDYYLRFGRNHTGIDLVPSDEYYKSSKTYKEAGKAVIFATINGTVSHYVDQYGGETVEITNSDNSFKAVYIHFSRVLVESGQVSAGTPIGIMGATGFTTGEHGHYEVRVKDGNSWKAVNPLNYIQ